jgi:hypothetical protein
MAYQVPPNSQIPRTVRIPILGSPFYRYGSLSTQRDMNVINFYYDRITKEDHRPEFALKKRPGLQASGYSLSKNANTDSIRGYFYDIAQNAFYWAVNNKVYNVKPDSGNTVRTVATLPTSSGYVGFCSYLQSNNTAYVVITDGQSLWLDNWGTTTCTQVADPDLPVPHVPCPVYIDGYIFLIKSGTSDVYNCDTDNPSSWTAGNFFSAEMSADYAVRLVKAKNYLVVMGSNSTEYYWDAGNATGSPMSRNDAPFRNIGFVTGFAQAGDKIFFVGQNASQNIGVYLLDGFTVQKISNEIVDRTLQSVGSADNMKSNVYLNRDGYIVSIDGHDFYVLVTNQTTWVYDIDEKMWYEWKGSDGAGLQIEASWPMYDGAQYLAITNQSAMTLMSQALYNDFGSNFTCTYTTEDIDAETVNNKFCYRFTLISDKYNNTGASNCSVYWSDDDWASSIGPVQVNVFNDLACARQLGKFRTRSFRISYADNYPLRVTAFEIDVLIGNY